MPTLNFPCVLALLRQSQFFQFFFFFCFFSFFRIDVLENNCRRCRVFQNIIYANIKVKMKNENIVRLCTLFSASRPLFELHKPDERSKKLISFPSSRQFIAQCWLYGTRKHPHNGGCHTAVLTQCNRCIRTEFICNVTATTQNRIEWMHLQTQTHTFSSRWNPNRN